MNCPLCRVRYAMAEYVPDRSGLLQPMCIECAAKHARPAVFPDGTQRTPRSGVPRVDFADHERERTARLLELHTAQRDSLAHSLNDLLRLFRREITGGYSTPEQQQAYRHAMALLAECGL